MSSKLQKHACLQCKRRFTSYNVTQRYCSRACHAATRPPAARYERVCLTCKASFTVTKFYASAGRGLYCSRACSARRLTSWDKEAALKLWGEGKKCKQIAEQVGISAMTLRRWLQSQGVYELRYRKGDQCWNWNNGISEQKYAGRIAKSHWGNCCFYCGYGEYPQVLQGHHRNRDRSDNSPDNLIPLCPTCHELDHLLGGDGRFSRTKTGCKYAEVDDDDHPILPARPPQPTPRP
jgi:hypothetical protein